MLLFHFYLKSVPVLLLWYFMWLVIVVINFIFSSHQFNILLLTSTLSYLLGFLSDKGKRFLYVSPIFSFSLVSNFAISISMFGLVAITSFPSWELVAFSQSLQHADLCWYEFQLFHLGVLHFSMLCWKGTAKMWKGRSLLFCIYHLRQTLCCLHIFPVRWIPLGSALGMAA